MVAELVIHLGGPAPLDRMLRHALNRGTLRIDGAVPFVPPVPHDRLAAALLQSDPAVLRRRFARAGALLDASSAAIGILSSIDFGQGAPDQLATAIADHLPQYRDRLRVIAYLRPHADDLAALWGDGTEDPDTWLTRMEAQDVLHHAPRFAHWASVFGAAFTLRANPDQGDVLADFADWLARGRGWTIDGGVTGAALVQQLHDRAEQMTPALPPAALDGIGIALGPIIAAGTGPESKSVPPPLPFDRAVADRIVARCAADAAALDAAFFPDGVMTRALASAPDRARGAATDSAALRLDAAALDLLLRIAATDPARLTWALGSSGDGLPPHVAQKPLGQPPTLPQKLPRALVSPLGRVTRAIRTTLRRLGW